MIAAFQPKTFQSPLTQVTPVAAVKDALKTIQEALAEPSVTEPPSRFTKKRGREEDLSVDFQASLEVSKPRRKVRSAESSVERRHLEAISQVQRSRQAERHRRAAGDGMFSGAPDREGRGASGSEAQSGLANANAGARRGGVDGSRSRGRVVSPERLDGAVKLCPGAPVPRALVPQ
eukprot:scaffold63_cov306-Pinguiococcus_pyrenoidosus.AAC.85